MKYFTLVFYFFAGLFLSFGQENNSPLQKKLDEIDFYRKEIDAHKEKYAEVYDTKVIKNIELEERKWEAYVLKENAEKAQALRIKYTEYAPKEIVNLNFYYKNGELVFGEYYRKLKQKNKKATIYKAVFYFENAILIHQKNSTDLKFDLKTFLNEEKSIKQMLVLE